MSGSGSCTGIFPFPFVLYFGAGTQEALQQAAQQAQGMVEHTQQHGLTMPEDAAAAAAAAAAVGQDPQQTPPEAEPMVPPEPQVLVWSGYACALACHPLDNAGASAEFAQHACDMLERQLAATVKLSDTCPELDAAGSSLTHAGMLLQEQLPGLEALEGDEPKGEDPEAGDVLGDGGADAGPATRRSGRRANLDMAPGAE